MLCLHEPLLLLLLLLLPSAVPVASNQVTVHVVQSCHLDVGFAELAAVELENYKNYFLQAVDIANDFRQNPGQNGEGQIFTTHSFLVSLLLDCPPSMGFACPTQEEHDIIVKALQDGDLVMQALPHNAQTDTFSSPFFDVAINLAKAWSNKLGIPEPLTMTQRDVPGATRAIIPRLVKAGILAYSGGVNLASLPPAVPKIFKWVDMASNTSVLGLVHPNGYGGIDRDDCVTIDGLPHVLCMDYNYDNTGPWTRPDVEQHWQQIMAEFPGAKVVPSTYDTFVRLAMPFIDTLPVVTQEMGDTWIYGVPSDPLKVSMYREAVRAWEACAETTCPMSDPRVANFTRLLLKKCVAEISKALENLSIINAVSLTQSHFFTISPEHTWGGDVGNWLNDTTNWSNDAFHKLQFSAPNFLYITRTWQEQRDWGLTFALEALQNHPLGKDVRTRWRNLVPLMPDLSSFVEVADVSSFTVSLPHVQAAFDIGTGALRSLKRLNDGWDFATNSTQIGVLEYHKYSMGQYAVFWDEYAQRLDGQIPSWMAQDFGKLGLVNDSLGEVEEIVDGRLQTLYWSEELLQVVAEIALTDMVHNVYGAPQVFNKTATRYPEAMWLRFNPVLKTPGRGWTMDKLDSLIDPLDVMVNGSRHLHAVKTGVFHTASHFSVLTLDAPVVSWGAAFPFPTPSGDWQPDLLDGVNFCLWNNIWGTNYIMWYPFVPSDMNILYRFKLDL
eukprot:m.37251 g.37251  ORF g.37251 m.37251 type:complete len:723 (-) comp11520_c0_seq4:1207-3375(-)